MNRRSDIDNRRAAAVARSKKEWVSVDAKGWAMHRNAARESRTRFVNEGSAVRDRVERRRRRGILPRLRLPFATAALAMLLAAALPAKAQAASAYLGDTNGGTSITVTAGDDFQVVLWVSSVTKLSGYDCRILVDGPATPTAHAAHAEWFSYNRTLFPIFDEGSEDPEDPRPNLTPADRNSAMLSSPPYITGSGDIVVFTLHADEEGTAAIDVDPAYFSLADTYEQPIEVSLPSTLYVTIEGGEERGGREEFEMDSGESGPFSGTVWYVDGIGGDDEGSGTSEDPFKTIQHAIGEAASNDTIPVAGAENGIVYEENLLINTTLHLYGARNPQDDWVFKAEYSSIVLGDSENAAIEYHGPGPYRGTLSRFTVTGGAPGIIIAPDIGPWILRNKITGNPGNPSQGGGIQCVGTTEPDEVPRIEFNEISNNGFSESMIITDFGGAIDLHGFQTDSELPEDAPLIIGNVIKQNKSDIAGGGISVRACEHVTLVNNLFVGNHAAGGGEFGGGAMYLQDSQVTLTNNTAVDNTANVGAGILVRAHNSDCSATATNLILWDNNHYGPPTDAEIAVNRYSTGLDASFDISYSAVEGGSGGCDVESGCTLTWGAGNISPEEGPGFGDDYNLAEGSDCIDAGTDEGAPHLDADNKLRPADGDGDEDPETDMGAYEYGAWPDLPEVTLPALPMWPIPGDANTDCAVNVLDLIVIRNAIVAGVDPRNDWRYDVNEDGRINILDLLFTRNRIGSECPEE